jgi:mitotic-spindle organizing protein 1
MEYSNAQKSSEAFNIVFQISEILDTGLDQETLAILIALCESGVNPEALATLVKELRREVAALKSKDQGEGRK